MRSPCGLSDREPEEPLRSSWRTGWVRLSLSENSLVRGACLFSSPGRWVSVCRMSLILIPRGFGPVLGLAVVSQSLGPLVALVFLYSLSSSLPFGRSVPSINRPYRSESVHIRQDSVGVSTCRGSTCAVGFLDGVPGSGALPDLARGERAPKNDKSPTGNRNGDLGVGERGSDFGLGCGSHFARESNFCLRTRATRRLVLSLAYLKVENSPASASTCSSEVAAFNRSNSPTRGVLSMLITQPG